MTREERIKKAQEVRKAIGMMRQALKTASDRQRVAIYEDLDLAMTDYDNLMGAPDVVMMDAEPPVPASPLDEGMSYMDAETEDLFGGPAGYSESMYMEEEPAGGMAFMDEEEPVEACGLKGTDSMIEAMDEEMPVAGMAYSAAEQENRDHVSYILDRTSEVVRAIEDYELRAKKAGKQPKSAAARKTIAGHMKRLASVVNKADFSETGKTGKALDQVGTQVMAMHKQLVQQA